MEDRESQFLGSALYFPTYPCRASVCVADKSLYFFSVKSQHFEISGSKVAIPLDSLEFLLPWHMGIKT